MGATTLLNPLRVDPLLNKLVCFYASLALIIGVTDATNLLYMTSAATGIGGVFSVGMLFAAYILAATFLTDESYGLPVRHAYTELLIAFGVLYLPVFIGVAWIRFEPASLLALGILQLLIIAGASLSFLTARRLKEETIRRIMQIALFVYVGSVYLDLYTKGLISELSGDRPGGFLNNANDGAFMISALLLVALPWKKCSASGYLLVLIALAGVLITLSRSGLFLWFCVSFTFGISRLIHGNTSARAITVAMGVTSIFVLLIFLAAPAQMAQKVGMQNNVHRIESIALALNGHLSALNDSDRNTLLVRWLEKTEERPLLGWGSYYVMSGEGPLVAMKRLGPHNMYVARMADTGVIGVAGLTGFLLLMAAGFRARHFDLGFYYTAFYAVACMFSHNLADTRPLLALFGILTAQSARSISIGEDYNGCLAQ